MPERKFECEEEGIAGVCDGTILAMLKACGHFKNDYNGVSWQEMAASWQKRLKQEYPEEATPLRGCMNCMDTNMLEIDGIEKALAWERATEGIDLEAFTEAVRNART